MINRLGSRTDEFGRRVLRNATAMVGSEVLGRIGVFVSYVLVARLYGEDRFTELSLALVFLQSSRTIAAPGIQTLLTREVSRRKAEAPAYLLNGSLIVACLGILAQAVAVMVVLLLDYPVPLRYAILVMGCGVVPFALGVVSDAVLQGLEKMQYITLASGVSNAFALVGVISVALLNGPFEAILWLLVLSYLISLGIKWMALRQIGVLRIVPVHRSALVTLLKGSLPFAGIRGLQAVMNLFLIVLVSKLVSETAAGVFNAAVQLMNPINLLVANTMHGTLPILADRAQGVDTVSNRFQRLLKALMTLAVPASVGLLMVSDSAIRFLYGEGRFMEAAPVLETFCWVVVMRALTQVFGQYLIVSGRERTTVKILVVDFALVVTLAPVLVSYLGLKGAALSVVLLRGADMVQHCWAVRSRFDLRTIGLAIWAPASASGVMAIALLMLGSTHVLLQVALGAACYITSLAAILWLTDGLPKRREPGAVI